MARLITRSQARSKGLSRYFTGQPCKHGHIAARMVCNTGCIVCITIKLKEWAKSDRGRRAARVRQRTYRAKGIQKRSPGSNRGVIARRSYDKNINKVRARTAVRDALRSGRLSRKPCKCGNPRSQAHHSDYNKPLKVKWLCSKCHGLQHRRD